MKTKTFTIVFFASLITLLCDAQNVELAKSEQTGLWEYSEVIESDGSASDLYLKFLDWAAKSVIPNQSKSILNSFEEEKKALIQISGSPAPVNPVRPLVHTSMDTRSLQNSRMEDSI